MMPHKDKILNAAVEGLVQGGMSSALAETFRTLLSKVYNTGYRDCLRDQETKQRLDELLLAMLGSKALVQRWWHGPNQHFDLDTPEQVFVSDPERVERYVVTHYDPKL